MTDDEWMQKFEAQLRREKEKFKKLKDLDSAVFVEIPLPDFETNNYRIWLESLEERWITEFNGNRKYRSCSKKWNEESGIGGQFEEDYFDHCKLYRFDGTLSACAENDWRKKRGFWIRDHYSESDVVKAHTLADNLCVFLTLEKIEHTKISFDRKTRNPVLGR
jgi:hypothetical protein